MRIAFVHDWFKANGGAEKVAGDIIDIYKQEELSVYALFDKFTERDRKEILKDFTVKTSFIQWLPYVEKYYRYLFPLMPYLISQFRLNGFDAVVSTSHAVAKSITIDSTIPHICYCHTPMRYAWDMYDDYVENHKVAKLFIYKRLIMAIRKWDLRTSNRVHYYIANSEHVRRRIKACYNREAKVIYPPVRVNKFGLNASPRKDYYMCLGRFVPYKKIDTVVRAFQQMPDKKLILIGEGYGSDLFKDLLSKAPNIEWLGYKTDAEMITYMQEAKACIFAAKEDFGIMCVEVQACGTPVLALNYGGYQETVTEGVSGYFFNEQTESSIIAAVKQFEAQPLTHHEAIRANALKFSDDRFKREIAEYVTECMSDFNNKAIEAAR